MAPHSSTLAWGIPWMEEPGGLQSMGSLGVGHDWATLLSLFTFMHWGGKWQPTPVFLPGESHGLGSLVGCRWVGHDWSDLAPAAAMPNDVEYLHVCWQFVYVFWKNVCLDTLPFSIHLSLLLSGKNSSYVLNTGLLPDISLYYLCSFCEPVIILSWKVFL